MHYFDYAATTPLCEEAKLSMISQLEGHWQNPSAQYEAGLLVQKQLKSYKNTISTSLGCKNNEFFFTSCGTESNNWAISRATHAGRHKGNHCITTSVEHSSVLEPFKALEASGMKVTYLKPNSAGIVTAEQVEEALCEDTIFVSIMMVNNETGALFPIVEIAEKVKKYNKSIIFHTDAIQGFLKVPFSLSGVKTNDRLLNVDLLSISAHKVYGPKGMGGLFIRQGLSLQPLLFGGGQEEGQRSGTQATHQIAAFAAAVEKYHLTFHEDMDHLTLIKREISERIAIIPEVKLIFSKEIPTAPHISAFSLVGYPSQVVVRFLSDLGIYLSAGSACHRGGSSHVFAALPLTKQEKLGALRLSISKETTAADVDALVAGLEQATMQLCRSM